MQNGEKNPSGGHRQEKVIFVQKKKKKKKIRFQRTDTFVPPFNASKIYVFPVKPCYKKFLQSILPKKKKEENTFDGLLN